jgi:NAD(P)-dependent dehydrogenase (short-subunit alcohol dehydrogenase family)
MERAKRVLITGGTRGLGYALAREFSKAGCRVFLTGRSIEAAKAAASSLSAETGGEFHAGAGDSGSWEDTARLAAEAKAAMGGIDVWVSNAGVNQGRGMVWELEAGDMAAVLRTDLLGPMLSAKAAFDAMRERGGWLWFVEGHGSDGRIMAGLSAYGTAKRGLAYLWRALALEAASSGSKVEVGAVSPGIMITDFVRASLEDADAERRKRTLAAFNALGDRPETVAAFLVPRMLAARKGGARIAWLTGPKIMWRFLSAPITRRRLIG